MFFQFNLHPLYELQRDFFLPWLENSSTFKPPQSPLPSRACSDQEAKESLGEESLYKLLTDSLTPCRGGGNRGRLPRTFIDSLISCCVVFLCFWHINGFYILFVIHYGHLEVFWSRELE